MNIAAGREVHHRVGSVVNGGVQLLELFFHVGRDGRVTDIGVDLAERRHADCHRLEFGMVDVRRNDHASARDFIAHQFGRDPLAVSDVLHLVGDHAPSSVMHLREVAVGVFGFALREPLCPRFENLVQTIAVSVVCAIACGHFRLYHPWRSLLLKLYRASGTRPASREGRLVSCASAGENESLCQGRDSN